MSSAKRHSDDQSITEISHGSANYKQQVTGITRLYGEAMSKNHTAGFDADILSYNYLGDSQTESAIEIPMATKDYLQIGKTASQSDRDKAKQRLTGIAAKALRLIWLSIILGLLIEVALVVIALWFGRAQGVKPFIADLVQKIAWSTIVCLGLGMGTAISKLPVSIAGLTGLFAAPLAFQIARSLHKGVAETLSIVAGNNEYYPPMLMGLVKGLEYACLGLLIVWLGKQPWGKALAHVGAGLWVGAVFGSVILILIFGAAPRPIAVADFIARAVNELFFPIGCALVVFFSNSVGKMAMGKN
jgi:hypothetical protein